MRLVTNRRQLLELADEPVYAQRYVPNSGYDHKAYVVGQQVRVVRKRSPLEGLDGLACEQPAHPEIERLSLLCGRLFGLEVYGVDMVLGRDGWQVLEVNDFPGGFSGVDDAPDWLMSYLVRASRSPYRSTAQRR